MDARTFEGRLTTRLLALASVVLVAVGIAAVMVTRRVLDSSDTESARAHATSAREMLDRELAEGDTEAAAMREVVLASEADGVKLMIRRPSVTAGATSLSGIERATCATIEDEHDVPWRACATGDATATFAAAIPIGAHRAALGALAREMVVVIAAALVAMWFAVRRAVRPPVAELEALVAWASRVAEAEPIAAPPVAETHEIARLEAAFDGLVRRLLDALARQRATSAHIAHELRTPLTAIVTDLDTVRAADDASRAAIDRVRGDVARLADVIDAILLLSAGSRASDRGESLVNLADLARELAPPSARVEAPDEALVEGDDRLLRLALRNLVENAAKYGAGARLVRVAREGRGLRLAVVDEGPGLDDDARGRMFERYWRGTADGEGRGLGLALVRAVAERHGGAASARPGEGGRGLEVSITLDPVVEWHEHAPPGSADALR